MIVLDASAVIELLVDRGPGTRLAARIAAEGGSLHVPHLLPIEVTSTLRRMVAHEGFAPQRAALALGRVVALPATRHEHEPLLSRVWELRDNLSAYDAVYIALAESLDAPLITTDRRLARAPGHRARVELLEI
jgi:predicted nucleic acid-binding protein